MPKLRRHIYLSAIVLLLSSCIYDEMQEGGQTVPSTNEEQKPVAPQPIQLSATLLDARTRAADGENEGNFALETPVTVSVDGNNYSYKTDAASTSNPLDCQDAVPPYFPIDGSSVRIMAYYPSTMQYATTVRTFTVAHDQSQTAAGTANYKASDLMVGLPKADFADASSVSLIDGSGFGRKVKPTSLSIPLEFEHKMVKIRLNTTNNGATVRKVEMTGIKRSIDFNPSDTTFQNLALATGDTDAAANSVIMYEDATGSTSNVVCTALIPKQDLTSGTPFITVTTASGTPLVYKLPENYYFAPGKQYRFNVNINDYEITATSDVTDWDDDTSFNMGDGLAVRKNIKMNPLWYVAEYNMTNTVSATTLTMGNADDQGYYYNWEDAMTKFSTSTDSKLNYYTGNKVIQGVEGTWHLPTVYEFNSILPLTITPISFVEEDLNHNFSNIVGSDNSSAEFNKTVTLCFGFNETTKGNLTEVSYWYRKDANTYYAVRYCGQDYCSVWKYERSGTASATTHVVLTITCKLLCYKLSTSDAARIYGSSESKWEAEFGELDFTNHGIDITHGAVQRKFCGLGYRYQASASGPNYDTSAGNGWYWTATLGYRRGNTEITNGNHLWFAESGEHLYHASNMGYGFTIRLFRDN